ncbi:MAG: 4-oxalocrotonate tautomerase [Burkholderiales bacterium]|jgi:4-oxalocrotonate tautomerase
MPIMRVVIAEGASPEAKATMFFELTEAAHRALGTPRENVRIILNEIPASHYAHGGVAAGGSTHSNK